VRDDPPVLIEPRHGPALLLTMNRPERHDAHNAALTAARDDAVERAERHGGVRERMTALLKLASLGDEQIASFLARGIAWSGPETADESVAAS
jgi:hypothetical protein